MKTIRLTLVIVIYSLLLSCSGGSGGSDEGDIDEELARSFVSECGVVDNGDLMPIPSRAIRVEVQVVGVDTFVITPVDEDGDIINENDKRLVKLHGVRSVENSLKILHGISVLKEHVSDGAYFVSAGRDCSLVDEGGGEGILGQLYSLEGINLNELMIAEGSAISFDDICGGEMLAECYKGIDIVSRPFSDIELDKQEASLSSNCGVVENGTLRENLSLAEVVSVSALSSTHVLAKRLLGLEAGNSIVVKLHGLSSEGIAPHAARLGVNFITEMTSPEAYLVLSSQECVIDVEEAGSGFLGHLFTKEGTSINEALITNGYASATEDICGGELLTKCYNELQSEAPVVEQPESPAAPPSVHLDENSEDGFDENLIRNFLWKPKSERNGNLVILVNPLNVRVVVTGDRTDTLVDFGPSNGRGTTARASQPGCSYGSNIKVEFYNSKNELIPVKGEGNSVTVSNGCQRMEFRR